MATIIVLRIVHIFFGVFWAGGVMFLNVVVGPALAASGPAGMQVIRVMHKRRLFHVILAAALLNILSGIDLLRRDSGNFSPGWFRSPMGIGLSTGMLAAIVAFLVALLAINPAMNRMCALIDQMMDAPAEARDGFMAQIAAARSRMMAFGMVGMLFLVIAVLTMATARYWG